MTAQDGEDRTKYDLNIIARAGGARRQLPAGQN